MSSDNSTCLEAFSSTVTIELDSLFSDGMLKQRANKNATNDQLILNITTRYKSVFKK